jgi:hypothetical protein
MRRVVVAVGVCASFVMAGSPGVSAARSADPSAVVGHGHAPRIPAPDGTPGTGGLRAAAVGGWSARNWAGYAVTGSGFTSVSGNWRVPSVSRTKKSSYSASWLGIDGFDNGSLIQAGTSQDWSGGAAHYYAWWEILPAYETPIPPNVLAVRPGDLIRVTITQGSPTWTIAIANATTGQSYTTHQRYTGPRTSAEWIEETPTIGRRVARLAVFSRTTFNDSTVNGNNPLLTSANRGVMVKGKKKQIATPSYPSSDRNGFAVQYGKITPPAPPT